MANTDSTTPSAAPSAATSASTEESSTQSYYYDGTNPAAQHRLLQVVVDGCLDRITAKAQQPLQQFQQSLPQDPASVRALPFYNAALSAIQHQRDQYLVGHAALSFDATALGHVQLTRLGGWFVPSATVKSALMPLVLPLPTGALYAPAVNGFVSTIPLAQNSLNRALKSSMLSFMENPKWREVIKNRTRGYVVGGENP